MATTWVASSGTLVSAVLETCGYHYQAYILQNLQQPFHGGSVGGFVYLIGVIVAIFHTAIRGGYKFGPWLIIGPPLFFSMVVPTEAVDSVLWRFGTQGRDQTKVTQELQRVDPKFGNSQANVSTVFARYNKLVSETVQEIVHIINEDKTETDRWFLLRAQLLGDMNTHTVETIGLKQLIQHALFTKCGRVVSAAQTVLDPSASDTRKDVAAMDLTQLDDGTILYAPTLEVAKYIQAVMLKQYGTNDNIDSVTTGCVGQSWELPDIMKHNLNCACTWSFVYNGIIQEAANTVQHDVDWAQANGIDPNKIMMSWAKAMHLVTDGTPADGSTITPQAAAQLYNLLTQAIAKYILRNEASNQTFAGFLAESAEKTGEFGTIQAPLESNLALTEYSRLRQQEWVEKTRMMTAATNLPYYQGLLLFFLGLSFPFFALLLLVPGKHAGFIQWFILWLWVKSWDIGFAVVMQLDDILFSMLGITQEFQTSNIDKNQLSSDFRTAMFAMKQSDPTFQLATYYNIIALCLTAIPIVSSQLILGSLSGGAGVVAQGIKALGDDFSSGSSNTAGQDSVSTLRHRLQENIQASASNRYRNQSQYNLAPVNLGPGKLGQAPPSVEAAAGWRNRAVIGSPQPAARANGRPDRAEVAAAQNILYGPNVGGASANRSLNYSQHTISDLQRASQVAGSLRGLATGWANPQSLNIFQLSTAKLGRLDSALGAIAATKSYVDGVAVKPYARVMKTYAEAFDSIGRAEIDPVVKWAAWDAYYSAEGQMLASYSRMMNQLEVPWSPSEAGEISEGKLEWEYLTQEGKIAGAITEASGDAFTAALSWTDMVERFTGRKK